MKSSVAAGLASLVLSLNFQVSGNLKFDSDENLLSIAFPTSTQMGEAWAALFLKNGFTDDLVELKKRQALVHDLSKNPDLLHEIRLELEQLKSIEESFLEIYDSKNWVNGPVVQNMFGQDEKAILFLLEAAIPKTIGLEQKSEFLNAHIAVYRQQNRQYFMSYLKLILDNYLALPSILLSSLFQTYWVLTGKASVVSKIFFSAWTGMFLATILHHPLQEHEELKKTSSKLIKKLQETAQVLQVILALEILDAYLPKGLEFWMKEHDRQRFKKFVQEVESLRMESGEFFQGDLAQAVASYRLLIDLRKPLAKYLERLARLDFYVSVAHRLHVYPNQFSFARLKAEPQVLLQAKSLWNPLLSPKIAVANDMVLGGDAYPQQMMITGPNASGKSTLMRAVMMNVYLAQSIGVVAAQEMVLRPFKILHSFMDHPDNTGLTSSYQQEVQNMKSVMGAYQKMGLKDRAFMILDEPFRSTNPAEAEEASRLILEHLCGYPQSVMMVSTHLSNLTKLPENQSCRRVNKFMQSYILQDGAYLESNALEILLEKLKTI